MNSMSQEESVQPSVSVPLNQEEQLENIIASYLIKKGFQKRPKSLPNAKNELALDKVVTQAAFLSEINVANYISFYNPNEKFPSAYHQSYQELKDYISDSTKKEELSPILYPLFIYCFLGLIERNYIVDANRFFQMHCRDYLKDNERELSLIYEIQSSEQLESNELVCLWRNNKYIVKMYISTFENLIEFLYERKFMILISQINMYISIQIIYKIPKKKPLIPQSHSSYPFKTNDSQLLQSPWFSPQMPENSELCLKKRARPYDPNTEDNNGDAIAVPSHSFLPYNTINSNDNSTTNNNNFTTNSNKKNYILPSIRLYTFFNTQNQLVNVAISSDGHMVAGCFSDSVVRMWDWMHLSDYYRLYKNCIEENGCSRYTSNLNPHYFELVGHSGAIYSFAFSPDNKKLLSASADKTVRLWSMETKRCTNCYYGHTQPIWNVQYSPEGYFFATASNDHTARLWAIDHRQSLRVFVGHLMDVNTVTFHPNGHYLLTGSADKSMRFWDITTGSCIRVFPDKQPLISTKITPNGKCFISSAENDKNVSIWDFNSGEKVMDLKGHQKTVWTFDVNTNDNIIVTGSEDSNVRLWDLRMVNEAYYSKNASTTYKPTSTSIHTPILIDSNLDNDSVLGIYPTKNTPIYFVNFSTDNLIFAAGPYKKELNFVSKPNNT